MKYTLKTLAFLVIFGVVSGHERCERESCFTGNITDKYVFMACRFNSTFSNLIIDNPLGFIQVKCVANNKKEICFTKPGVQIHFNSQRNEVVLSLERSRNIPEGTWVCRHNEERLTMGLSTVKGMLHATDIGIKASIRRKHNFYIFALDCFSCWRPFGDHVEFMMNGKALDELRGYGGMCYHTQVQCTTNICTCCNNSNRYILVHRENNLTAIQSFGCKMRFYDNYTKNEKIKEVVIPFHPRAYFGNEGEEKMYESEASSSSDQGPSGVTDNIKDKNIYKPTVKSKIKNKSKSDVTTNSASTLIMVPAMIVQWYCRANC